jgi:hypothetical protein
MVKMKESPHVDAAACAIDNEPRQWCACHTVSSNSNSSSNINSSSDVADGALQFKMSHRLQSTVQSNTGGGVLVAPKYRSVELTLGQALPASVPQCEEYDKKISTSTVPLALDCMLAPATSTMWRAHAGCEAFADAVALSLHIGSQVRVDAAVPGQLVCRINMRQTRIEWQYMGDTLDTDDIRRIVIPLADVAALGLSGAADGSVVLSVQPTSGAKLSIEHAARATRDDDDAASAAASASWQWHAVETLSDDGRHCARFAAGALDLAWTALIACSKPARQLAAEPLGGDVYCSAPSTSESRVSQT